MEKLLNSLSDHSTSDLQKLMGFLDEDPSLGETTIIHCGSYIYCFYHDGKITRDTRHDLFTWHRTEKELDREQFREALEIMLGRAQT